MRLDRLSPGADCGVGGPDSDKLRKPSRSEPALARHNGGSPMPIQAAKLGKTRGPHSPNVRRPLTARFALERGMGQDENCRAPGTLGEAQKQPMSWSPHLATRVQHSPPLCVIQQHSRLATSGVSTFGTSPRTRASGHSALSDCFAQLAFVLTDERVANINVNANTEALVIEPPSLSQSTIMGRHALPLCATPLVTSSQHGERSTFLRGPRSTAYGRLTT